jgi:hypothetical protein
MQAILNNLAALWGLFLLVAVTFTLLWFFYSAFLRKLVRLKRIERIRSQRELQRAAEQDLHEK